MLEGINFVLELWSDDRDLLRKFKEACYRNLGRDINWFHQSDTESYQLFEFWAGKEKFQLIQQQAMIVAKAIGKPLKVEIKEKTSN